MAQHTRRPGDKAYRQISLLSSDVPKFTAFTAPGQMVTFRDNEQLLEILLENDTTELFCGNANVLPIYYGFTGGNTVWLSCAESPNILQNVSARLWLRKDQDAMEYKVPSNLKVDGTRRTFQVPAGTGNIQLFGDKYFERVFELVRNG